MGHRPVAMNRKIKGDLPIVVPMKYTARHIRRFLDQGKIDADLWKAHFPSLLESCVPTCRDCGDFKSNLCQGGKDPVDCFLGIQQQQEPGRTGKLRSHGSRPWEGTVSGKRRHKITNKVFDQSKM
ncbi:MAG TPA: hypothetical protein VMS89_04030 [Methanoregulaceae archaeon]|nr:hypothetical protein [Methanoregulaceae archaeon]